MKTFRLRWAAPAVALTLLATVSACGERSPLAVDPLIEPPEAPSLTYDSLAGAFHNQAVVTCNVTMSPLAISCGSPQAPAGTTPAIGGRGNHVRLIASGLNYNAGTQVLRMNVSVQNWLVNQLGVTSDGTVTGITPFFHRPPTRTGGTGANPTVLNPDGSTPFLVASRPYFHYPQKLALQETSAQREWLFSVATTVTSFQFGIYVSADIMPVIVFDAVTGGNRDIWRVAPDGSDLVRLTSATTEEMEPTAAQNLVIFTRYIGGKGSLWSVPLSGGPMQPVLSLPENLGKPVLNRANTRLAFTRDEHGVTRIWTAKPNGTQLRTVTGSTPHPGTIEAGPTWHNTANARLFFVSTQGARPGIYWRNVQGSVTVPWMVSAAHSNVDPSHSPDGSLLAFTSNRRDGFAEIHVMETLGEQTVTRLTTRDLPDVQPTFLSDGNLAWLSYRPAPRLRLWDRQANTQVNIPNVTGGMEPRNPFGVPLYP